MVVLQRSRLLSTGLLHEKLIGKISGSVYRRMNFTLIYATWKKAKSDPINAKQYDMMRGGLTPSGGREMWCFMEKVARVSDKVK